MLKESTQWWMNFSLQHNLYSLEPERKKEHLCVCVVNKTQPNVIPVALKFNFILILWKIKLSIQSCNWKIKRPRCHGRRSRSLMTNGRPTLAEEEIKGGFVQKMTLTQSWMFMRPKRTKLSFLLSDGCRWRRRECLSQLISHCFSAAHFIMTWAYHLLEHEEPLRAKIWSLASVLGLQTPVTLASLHHPIHPFSFLSINLPAW